ncbi:Oxysterol-binding protein [Gaertneriomyces semiglobifer]|nr:Oxysterol-binding protein [Gaertneriomyces semiglobifer]
MHAPGYPAVTELRTALPLDPTSPKPVLSIWGFLKSAIGKDLSKVTLPVFFNEPLSMLQRMCEDVEYVDLLSVARLTGEDSSLIRLMYVGAYAMSNYSSTVNRVQKPFNPLLGETYELVRPDKQYRYLSEQVCHHPPISACYCDSPDYAFWTEVNVKSKFWGKSLEICPTGLCHHSVGDERYEHYTWKKVTTTVNNLIMGTLYIEHSGDMVIRNHRTNEECTLTFKPNSSGWMGSGGKKGKNLIVGTVKDRNGVIRWNIEGRWDEGLTATLVGTATGQAPSTLPLWRRAPLPPNPEKNFHFTYFANSLNQGTPTLNRLLPRTDSRLRPDQKAMERGEWQRADEYKEKVEKAQRERRRLIVEEYERTRKPSGPVHSFDTQGVIPIGEDWWTPRWFVREIETDTGEPHWRFTGEYWKCREKVLKASVGSDGLVLKDGDSAEAKWPEWVLDIFQV